jgi:hypothetical protein
MQRLRECERLTIVSVMYGIGVQAFFVSALGGREEKHLNPVRIVCRAGARSILAANISNQSQSNLVLLEKFSRLMTEIWGDAIEKSSATRFEFSATSRRHHYDPTTATNAARHVA